MNNGYRNKCLKQKINTCHVCGDGSSELVVHHINGDRTNNKLDNLTPLCEECHHKVHHETFPANPTVKRLQNALEEGYNEREWDSKVRVETYLEHDTVEALEQVDVPNSQFLREAARKELQRREIAGWDDE